ncbi:DUF1684 domain-containing protein [Robertkochia aurantiaca]|uniref:DUF1684 domain-containing protein n=1 Tax=Robertkochia aurantiaca TaxID=2873700 RepID=UPI001CC916ED|nr:DUF1684 domain-containing protein [Robertkochia sp. 3YJGBD-33]
MKQIPSLCLSVVLFIFLFACNDGKRYHDKQTDRADLNMEKGTSAQSVMERRKEKDKRFRDPALSPLKTEDLSDFEGLSYYEVDSAYIVPAVFERTPDTDPFYMPTTTDRYSREKLYGKLHFQLQGKDLTLNLYQNEELKNTEGYENYLFLPFADLTNTTETYAGGRYLDMSIPEGDTVMLDFNRAYNPLCVYNEKFSCPLVPQSNMLNVAVEAGEKRFEK